MKTSRVTLLIAALIVALFACTSNTHATLVFSESFSYADGSLVANSGGTWANTSGTAGQMDVASGVVNVTQAEAEDTNRPFSSSATKLYTGLTFSFSALPTGGTGNYFFHFLNTATSFRGKVFATTTGAAAGTLRIGVTNAANTGFVAIPTDIALGTTHRLVLSLDSSGTNVSSSLFLDSATETGGATATDGGAAALSVPITAVGLRQSTSSGLGMGVLTADNLSVATTYAEAFTDAAIPEASGFLFVGLAAVLMGCGRKFYRGLRGLVRMAEHDTRKLTKARSGGPFSFGIRPALLRSSGGASELRLDVGC